MTMKKTLIVLFLTAFCALAAWAEDPLSLSDLTTAAAEGNLDLLKAQSALETARKALAGTSVLENSKLSLSGSYGTGIGPESEAAVSGKGDLTVPIIPQLSLSASASSQGTASASISLSPFAAGTAMYKENETYQKAVLQLRTLVARLEYEVQAAAFAVVSARRALASAQTKSELEQERRTVAEKAYELSRISYEDLRARRSAELSARQGVFDAEKTLLNAKVALYKLLGPSNGEPEVKEVSADDLSALIAAREASLEKLNDAEARSTGLATLLVELESLEAQLDATPAYSPALSLSAHIDYPLAYGAGISFSFSPSDIKVDERLEIEESIRDKQAEISLERMASRFQLNVSKQALFAAKTVLETRKAELAQAEINNRESAELLKQGHLTSLEDRQTELDLESARSGVFSAMTGVLKAQADVLLMWK